MCTQLTSIISCPPFCFVWVRVHDCLCLEGSASQLSGCRVLLRLVRNHCRGVLPTTRQWKKRGEGSQKRGAAHALHKLAHLQNLLHP
jgi:hypothetical protein